MENARKKIRLCLLFVVTLAVIIGAIYYFRDVKGQETITEGTLVQREEKITWQA